MTFTQDAADFPASGINVVRPFDEEIFTRQLALEQLQNRKGGSDRGIKRILYLFHDQRSINIHSGRRRPSAPQTSASACLRFRTDQRSVIQRLEIDFGIGIRGIHGFQFQNVDFRRLHKKLLCFIRTTPGSSCPLPGKLCYSENPITC